MAEDTKVAAAKSKEAKTAAQVPAEAQADDAGTEMESMKKKFKPKKKVTLPTEMLSDAKSYDDKLILVKMLTEKERNRMILIIKNLLKDGLTPTKK